MSFNIACILASLYVNEVVSDQTSVFLTAFSPTHSRVAHLSLLGSLALIVIVSVLNLGLPWTTEISGIVMDTPSEEPNVIVPPPSGAAPSPSQVLIIQAALP